MGYVMTENYYLCFILTWPSVVDTTLKSSYQLSVSFIVAVLVEYFPV